MAIEVFNRHEIKYLLDEKTQALIIKELDDHMRRDTYNDIDTYQISNIYFDTDNDDLIANSVSKPIYKEKLRLRAYGEVSLEDFVYLEIKKKYDGIVNKRRTKIKLKEAYEFLKKKRMPVIQSYMNKQVIKELHRMIAFYDLKPKIYLAYERIAFFGIKQQDLRISFDTKTITRRNDLKLEVGKFGQPLLDDNSVIMEIKVKDSIPLWLTAILNRYKLVPQGFSKYGEEYRQEIIKKGDLLYV